MFQKFRVFIWGAISILSFQSNSFGQNEQKDSIFLMNGHIISEKIIDTLLNAITIINPKKPDKNINYEFEQLYMVKFNNGDKRYYYVQDSLQNNYFTRDEMWMYMKGEVDAHKGFRAPGSLIVGSVVGVGAGLTGLIWAPAAPFGVMALCGIPKVKIKAHTISNPNYVQSDAYILGYERVARNKRRINSLVGGGIGLAVGFGAFFAFIEKR
jgi:hypothetical protein